MTNLNPPYIIDDTFIPLSAINAFWDELFLLAGKYQLAYDNWQVRKIWTQEYAQDYVLEETIQYLNDIDNSFYLFVDTIPSFVTIGDSVTPPIDNVTDIIISTLTQVIESQTDYLTSLISDGVLDFLQDIMQAIQINQSIGRQILFQETVIQDMLIGGLEQTTNDVINGVGSRLDSAVSQLASLEQGTTSNIINQINTGNAQLLSAIQQIEPSASSIGDVVVNIDNPDYTALFNQFINLFSQYLNSFKAKEFSFNIDNLFEPTINIEGSGSGTGTDSSGSIGFGIDPITQAVSGMVLDLVSNLDANYDNSIRPSDLLYKAGKNGYDNLQQFFNEMEAIGISGNVISLAYKIANSITFFIGLAWSGSKPFLNNFETMARTEALDGILPVTSIMELERRKLADNTTLDELWSKVGMKDYYRQLLSETGTVQLQEYFLKELYLRDIFTYDQYEQGMMKLGYRQTDIPYIEQTYQNIPSIPDLVRFMVRDVYDESLVKEFGLDSEYELIKDKFESDIRKQGVSPEYAKYYYRANWQYASPTQAYEMLHRGLLTTDQLFNLLKSEDYPPFWRDRLMQLSYSPYTRVDLRRLYKSGVIDEETVNREYHWLGYDDEHADKLTEWTVKAYAKEDETVLGSLSLSVLTKAYFNGLISGERYRSDLSAMGYGAEEIDIIVKLSDLSNNADTQGDVTKDNRARIIRSLSSAFIQGLLPENYVSSFFLNIGYTPDKINDEIQWLKYERTLLEQVEKVSGIEKQYKSYVIDDNQARDRLIAQGYALQEANSILFLWKAVREDREREPTMNQVQGWLKKGIIDSNKFTSILKGMGYPDEYIGYYIEDMLE